MKIFIVLVCLFYLLPALFVYLYCKALANRIEKYMGKALYESYSRHIKDERSVLDYTKALVCIFVPILNLLCLLVMFTKGEEIYLKTLISVEENFKRWGIDFKSSLESSTNDYNLALDELNGLKRL